MVMVRAEFRYDCDSLVHACPSPPASCRSSILDGGTVDKNFSTRVVRLPAEGAYAILHIKDDSSRISIASIRTYIPFASSPFLPLSFAFLDCHIFPTRLYRPKSSGCKGYCLRNSYCRSLTCLCLFLGGSIPFQPSTYSCQQPSRLPRLSQCLTHPRQRPIPYH